MFLPILIVFASVLATRINIPPAILLVTTGVVLALIPGLPTVVLAPHVVLLFVMPLVIYSSAVAMSWREFRFNLRPITLLAVGCVVFTTIATAAVSHWVLKFSWAEGFLLGAIVSPPDAVAPLAIAKRLQLPRRLLVVLEGEGLANDATALVLYRFAVGAVSAGAFSLPHALGAFAAIAVGEIVWGLTVGFVMLRCRRLVNQPRLEILLSVMTPFIAYWPPEHLGGSGVLATVAAGLYTSWNGLRLISAATRLQGIFIGSFVIFVTEGMLFLLTGLQARSLIGGLPDYTAAQLALAAAVVSAVVIAARFVWIYPAIYIPRWLSASLARDDPVPSWQGSFALAFTGIRGVVSLVAALAIPLTREDGSAFPHRGLILFLTFVVIIVTLVGQGLLLPWVMRALGLAEAGRIESEVASTQEWATRIDAARTAAAHVDRAIAGRDVSTQWAQRIRALFVTRLRHIEEGASSAPAVAHGIAERRAIELELIAVERNRVNDLYRAGKLQDEGRRRIERDLDLREARADALEPDD